jgi:hypothetical protein
MLRKRSHFIFAFSSIQAVLALTPPPTQVWVTRSTSLPPLQASSSFFIGFSLCGMLSNVANATNAMKGLGESEVQFSFKEIFSAFHHLQMCHFLELENVMSGNRNVTKVADFGLAETFYNSLMQTFVVIPGFS